MVFFEIYSWCFTIQPANSETIMCGMHECIPYENVVPFSIQRAVFVAEGGGTHKCVPYETSIQIPIYRPVRRFHMDLKNCA